MTFRRARPRSLWAAWGVATVVLLLVAWDGAWLPDRILIGRDTSELYLPMKGFLKSALAHGHIPLWYPYDGVGLSVLGSLVFGLLDPLNVLLLFLSPAMAVKWAVLLSTVIGGLGVAGIARTHRLRWSAVWVAGMAFACSGFILSQTNSLLYLGAYSRIPLALWCAERLARRAEGGWAAGLALSLASIFWMGDPEAFVFAAGVAALIALAQAADRRRVFGWLTAAGALTTLLSLPALLPAWVTYGSSPRGSALSDEEALSWSFHPIRVLELALGSPFELNQGVGSVVYAYGGQNQTFFSPTVFMGLGVVSMAVVAVLVRRRQRGVLIYAAMTALGLWLAFGSFGHLYAHVPLLTRFRYPEKLMVWPTLGLAVLAGVGFQIVSTEARGAARLVIPIAALLVAGAAASLVFPPVVHGMLSVLPLGLAMLVASRLSRQRRAALLAVAFVVEPAWLNRGLVFQSSESASAKNPDPDVPHGARVCSDLKADDFGAAAPGQGWETIWQGARGVLAVGLGGIFGYRTTDALVPAAPAGITYLCGVAEECVDVCAQLTGASYAFLPPADADAFVAHHGGRVLRHVERTGAALVEYASRPAHAEIRPARAVDDDDHLTARDLHQGKLDVGATALVPSSRLPNPQALQGSGQVVAEDDEGDRIQIEADVAAPAVLRVHEAYSREWRATIDGAPADVWKIDLGLLGVPLRTVGKHTVELEFRPLGWPFTMLPWALGWLACLGLMAKQRWGRAATAGTLPAPAGSR